MAQKPFSVNKSPYLTQRHDRADSEATPSEPIRISGSSCSPSSPPLFSSAYGVGVTAIPSPGWPVLEQTAAAATAAGPLVNVDIRSQKTGLNSEPPKTVSSRGGSPKSYRAGRLSSLNSVSSPFQGNEAKGALECAMDKRKVCEEQKSASLNERLSDNWQNIQSAGNTFQSKVSSKKKKRPAGTFTFLRRSKLAAEAVLVITRVAGLIAIAYFVRFNIIFLSRMLLKPYCEGPSHTVSWLPDSLNSIGFLSHCKPCPMHASCSKESFHCEFGFQKSFGRCIPDRFLRREVEELEQKMFHFVCAQRSKFCGEAEFVNSMDILKAADGQVWSEEEATGRSTEVSLGKERYDTGDLSPEARQQIVVQKAFHAVARILQREEDLETGEVKFRCPHDVVPIFTRFSCYLRNWITSNPTFFLLIVFITIIAMCLMRLLWKNRKVQRRAEEIYEKICIELLSRAQAKETAMRRVVAVHLRDTLLSLREQRGRREVWQRVELLVKKDSRIAIYQHKVDGLPRVVWEWKAHDLVVPLK